MTNKIINDVLQDLRKGSLALVYKYKEDLNAIAMAFYSDSFIPTVESIEDFKNLLCICNIMYNNTDRELLPIEDGVYDLLFEKYKQYDSNFQVGAEVINFKAKQTAPDINVSPAIIFEEDIDKSNCYFYDQLAISDTQYIDHRDFENIPSAVSQESITKRKHDTQHTHPELVGTLDKCKFVLDRDACDRGVFEDSNVKILERDFFRPHVERGLIDQKTPFEIVMELKYDGISVEADCTDEVISARSRGDTGMDQAADLTPILKGYKFPHRTPGAPMVGVKFEAIMTRYDLDRFNKAKNYNYANCRSAIVGLFSSSDAWKYRDFITLVPLAVELDVYSTVCNSDRIQEIEFLNKEFVSHGCPLRYASTVGDYLTNLAYVKIFADNAEYLRSRIPFMYDGIVVSYRDQQIRDILGRENFINKFSMAVKFNPLKKSTVFRGYSYTVGQDGTITPMIHYDPVEFWGTIHDKSSGHSFARFTELKLHIGDIVDVEYVNDVMPYVSKPINDWNIENESKSPLVEFIENCPICGSKLALSKSGKSVKCLNQMCMGKQMSRMVNTCAKLGMNGFGEATIAQLGLYHMKDLMEILTVPNAHELLTQKGFGPGIANNLIIEGQRLIHKEFTDADILGAIGFTGISTKTWELILEVVNYPKIREIYNIPDPSNTYVNRLIEVLSSIKGIGDATIVTIASEFRFFKDDVDWLIDHGNVKPFVRRNGKKVFFTGFRDIALERFANEHGFYCNNKENMTMNAYALIVPDYEYNSAKVEKAKRYGIHIIKKHDFITHIDDYFNGKYDI